MKVKLYVTDIMSPEEDEKANLIKEVIDVILHTEGKDINPCDACYYEFKE